MYDNRKYNVNSFIGHCCINYSMWHLEQILSAKTRLNANLTNDVMNMQINMWRHLPPQVPQNPVGNTGVTCVSLQTMKLCYFVAEEYNVAIRAAQLIEFLIAITITDATIT